MIVGGIDVADARRIADGILDELRKPFSFNGAGLSLDASIGIAVRAGSAFDAKRLITDADAALYDAKAQGKGRHALRDAAGASATR